MAQFKNSGLHVQEYVYDFAVDGGAAGAIDLSAKAGKSPLPVGAIIKGVTAIVETACTSGGSATVAWGPGADADGYSGVALAVASLTANAVFNGYQDATTPSALLWNNTTDAPVEYVVTSTANTQTFTMTIATAALTAGKINFMVEYLLPGGV
jgi:hypothetical protein